MDVNDNAGCLDNRGAWSFFASKLAPAGSWSEGMHFPHKVKPWKIGGTFGTPIRQQPADSVENSRSPAWPA
jgi:hypothetical protein